MQHFVDMEREYLRWVRSNPNGYVVNTYRTPSQSYLTLHRASCWTITGTHHRNYTTGAYSKVCSERRAELERWAGSLGGALHPCGLCKP